MKGLTALVRDETGATAVEYGLIIGAVAGLIIIVVYALGGKVLGLWESATRDW
jgi:pilus assembly protein Flp/PilA